MKKGLFLSVTILLYASACLAANEKDICLFSRVDYQQGLSNSAVFCLFQDNGGLMWFGTYDGVNCYDGKNMEVFRSDFSKNKTLSNNVIHTIQQADSNCLWITTHLGVNRFSQISRQVVASNYDFTSDCFLHSNSKGNTWVVSHDGLYYYNTYHRKFVRFKTPLFAVDEMDRRSFVTDDGSLWVFQRNTGKLQTFSLDAFDKDTLEVRPSVSVSAFHSQAIDHIFYQNGIVCFIDRENDLYVYDILRKSKIYIRNISPLVQKYGDIKGIVPFYEDIIIGFRTSGLIRLRTSQKYEAEVIDRNVRIFDLYQDPRQGILWIASDGKGAIMYAKKYSIATNLKLSYLSDNLSRQVRSLMTDKNGGLWFGTKGDGLLHIPHYDRGMNAKASTVHAPGKKQTASDFVKWDEEFQVYKLRQSRYMDGFWIGSGSPGLCYYSFGDGVLRQVEDGSKDPVSEVHDIYEESDSVLYVLTASVGFRKLGIEKGAHGVRIKEQKRYHFFCGQGEVTMFYPMLVEGDSIFWLGSREKGLVRFDKRTEEYQVISLKEMLHKSVDDVLSMQFASDGKMYVGTTSGLVCLTFSGKKIQADYVGREQGMLNDMIHGILEDGDGFLWLSTNRGLTKYNPKNGVVHAYYYTGGLQIGEFSDDAYFRCPYTGELFFGGVDGLLYLNNKVETAPPYYPDILFRKLYIRGKEVSIGDYLMENGEGLDLTGAEAGFSLTFAVPDYVSGAEVEYSYMLEGYDEDWGVFSSANEVSYAHVPAGNYLLKVRYKKDVFNTEYKSFSIPIYIAASWYQSAFAYCLYLILGGGLVALCLYGLRKYSHYEQLVKKMLAMKTEKGGTSEKAKEELAKAPSIVIEGLGDLADRIVCSTSEQAEFIRRVLQVIERNIGREDLGSTFIADQLAMSPRQFYRKFKEISGMPPGDLIKNYRIEKAARLLMEGELSIQECITDIGIISRSYFYKEFTRKYGMTPKDFREQHKAKKS